MKGKKKKRRKHKERNKERARILVPVAVARILPYFQKNSFPYLEKPFHVIYGFFLSKIAFFPKALWMKIPKTLPTTNGLSNLDFLEDCVKFLKPKLK